jgi:hypothetical protein
LNFIIAADETEGEGVEGESDEGESDIVKNSFYANADGLF